MKAIVLDRPGSLESLRLAEVPTPQPGVGEVRVQVQAVGLNPVDYQFAQWGHPLWQYPHTLGLDVAGTIDALGEGVTDWQTGDAVYYHGDLRRSGGFAEWAVTTAHTLAPLPQGLDFPKAAALPCAGWTAYQVLYRRFTPQSGQTILIHGGAGGVGGFAIQLARLLGLEIFTTCSPNHGDWVKQLGAQVALDYHTEDIPQRVLELTQGRGLDWVIDAVSGANATASLPLLTYGGGIACLAGVPDLQSMRGFGRSISIHTLSLGGAHQAHDRQQQADLARMGQEFGTLVSQGKVKPLLEEIVPLAAIPRALMRLAERHVRGKIVAQIHRS